MSVKVLIVDDAPFIREVLSHIIQKGGFTIVGEATNGVEAIEMTESLKPDVVIMDIVMPKKSGIEATKEIMSKRPETKIIACTTEGQENMVVRALEAGCCDCVIKPFNGPEVLRVIEHSMSSKE